DASRKPQWEYITPLLDFPYDPDRVSQHVGNRTRWGSRKRPWSPKLHVLRFVDPVAVIMHPIEAVSDDGAIFELLYQVGCRMPKPQNRPCAPNSTAADSEAGRKPRRGRRA